MLDFDEFIAWIVSSLLSGFILSIKLKWPMLFIEPSNLLLMSAFSLIMFFIYILGQKIAAWFFDSSLKVKLITFRRYWFRDKDKLKWSFPLWLIMPLLLFFISLSRIKWLAILNFDTEPKISRIGRKFFNLSDIDIAKIAAAGPLASLIFALFLKVIGIEDLAIYPALLAFLSVIPLGNGAKIFFGSRTLSIFLFVLSGLMFLLMPVGGWLVTLAIALLIAIFVVIAYYISFEQ